MLTEKEILDYNREENGEEIDRGLEALGDFSILTKYAKWIPELNRRETWNEVCIRNMEMHLEKFADYGEDFLNEIKMIYTKFVIPKLVLPSMRSMQFAGKPIELSPNRMYNCAYMPIDSIEAFSEAMFLSLGGTGVGFSVQKHHVEGLPEINKPNPDKYRRILINDSIEGWADSIQILFVSYTGKRTSTPRFDYGDIRAKGEPLRTSGGKAPGPAPLRECLVKIENMLLEKKDGDKLRPIECHDMMCHIADAVLSGGIRRSAMISLFSVTDMEMINAKTITPNNDFNQTHPHRHRANNSAVILRHRIKKPVFSELWKRIKLGKTGEPGIYLSNDKDWGTNPCCEIGLRPYQFCNLTECNVSDVITQEDLEERAKAAAFLGTLQASYTDFHYLREIWSKTTEKDALLGVSMTGIASNKVSLLDIEHAAEMAKQENARVAEILGINKAARVTCIKPSGTASTVLGTSSGIHAWYGEYYIRRVTINKQEPVYPFLMNHAPEFMEDCEFNPENDAKFSIPIKAPTSHNGVKSTTRHETALDMLERIKRFSIRWVQRGHRSGTNTHNVSATVSIRDDEWDAVGEWMWMNRHYYNGLSVTPYDITGSYRQIPFEEIDKKTYEDMESKFPSIDFSLLTENEDFTDFGGEIACAGGVCEI